MFSRDFIHNTMNGGPNAMTAATRTKPELKDHTAIHIPKTTHELLRSVAFRRAKKSGGRASVSAVITQLVEANRAALEKEAGPFL